MKQYIITSGVSMVQEIDISDNKVKYTITNNKESAKKYNFIGDAMRDCVKINDYTNIYSEINKQYNYRVCPC